ncbi:hypothetical protein AB6D63_18965, partial [Vibrio splendidus]
LGTSNTDKSPRGFMGRIHSIVYNAAVESFFEHIEMFYNVNRRHGSNNQLSSVEYEEQYKRRLTSVCDVVAIQFV